MRGTISQFRVSWDINALLQLIEDDLTDIRLFTLQAMNMYQNYRD